MCKSNMYTHPVLAFTHNLSVCKTVYTKVLNLTHLHAYISKHIFSSFVRHICPNQRREVVFLFAEKNLSLCVFQQIKLFHECIWHVVIQAVAQINLVGTKGVPKNLEKTLSYTYSRRLKWK